MWSRKDVKRREIGVLRYRMVVMNRGSKESKEVGCMVGCSRSRGKRGQLGLTWPMGTI